MDDVTEVLLIYVENSQGGLRKIEVLLGHPININPFKVLQHIKPS